MHATIILGTLCALVAHTATAAAAPPAWCKGGDEKPSYDLKSLYTETDAQFALMGIVAASCYPEADLAGQDRQLAALRAGWSKKLALAEGDWADVSEWAHLQRHLRGDPKIDVTDRQAAWSSYSPIDQYGALSTADIGQVDAAYLADAFGPKLTQLGRLGYVTQILAVGMNEPSVRYAMGLTDATLLDLAKISAEIRADGTHNAADRMTARIVAYETIAKLPKYFADVKALRAKDPAYEKMFALGEAAHKQWTAVDPKLVALVGELDDAQITGSRKASAGCAARTWEAWKTAIAAMPAKQFAQIHGLPENPFLTQLVQSVVATPNGYLTALAMLQCAGLESSDETLAEVIADVAFRWPGMRGPRTATQTAILTAGLVFDKRETALDYPTVSRLTPSGTGTRENGLLAAIDSVKVEGDTATIAFAKRKVKQTRCTKGHMTSRIVRIWPDGTFQYYYQCDAEVTETIEVAPSPPLKVAARYATGLAKGMSVQVGGGVAVVAYPAGSATPSFVTGVGVK